MRPLCKPATSFTERTGNIAYSSAIMPWQEYQALEQRMMFIAEYESEGGSVSALRARYAVSRMTVYKYLDRLKAEGRQCLWDRSRAPHRVRHALSEKLVR